MLRTSLIYCLLFTLASSIYALSAVNPTGKNLLDYCEAALDIFAQNSGRIQTENEFLQGSKAGICEGYLMSVKQLHNCDLPAANKLQMIALVTKYLKNHPQALQQPAATVEESLLLIL